MKILIFYLDDHLISFSYINKDIKGVFNNLTIQKYAYMKESESQH